MSFVKIFDTKGDQIKPQLFQKLKLQLKNNQSRKQQDLIIHQIVELTLQSRPLCRPYEGKILDGIYQELYTQVHDLLIIEIRQIFDQKKSIQILTLETVNQFQIKCFQNSLNDQTLKKFALYAQKQTDDITLRHYCLTELVKAIKISERLCKPHQGLFKTKFYPVIYDEAVGETMNYICTNIEKYDPNRNSGKFMSWVNFKLNKLVLDCRKKFDLSTSFDFLPLPDFEMILYEPQAISSGAKLYQVIQQDTNQHFRKTYLPSDRQINFQQVALQRLSGYKWQEIAQNLNSNTSVLISFYRRNCEKFKKVLAEEIEL